MILLIFFGIPYPNHHVHCKSICFVVTPSSSINALKYLQIIGLIIERDEPNKLIFYNFYTWDNPTNNNQINI